MFILSSSKFKVTKDPLDKETQVVGKRGLIHSHGTAEINVWVLNLRLANRLERLGFKVVNHYDDGACFILPVSELDRMAGFIKARKKRVVTEQMRQKGRDLAARFKRSAAKDGINAGLVKEDSQDA